MSRRMTVVFDDEALYTALEVAAARRGCYAKDIVAAAVREGLEAQEDATLQPALEQARQEWRRSGGVEAEAFFRDLEAGQWCWPPP